MMSAFSLRTWRRNGVACDELLFLPGTAHGITHGVDSPPASHREPSNASGDEEAAPLVPHLVVPPPAHAQTRSEGDIAAGAPTPDTFRRRSRSTEGPEASERGKNTLLSSPENSKRAINFEGSSGINNQHRGVLGDLEMAPMIAPRLRSESFDSSLGWGSDEESVPETDGLDQSRISESLEEQGCLSGGQRLLCRSNVNGPGEDMERDGSGQENNSNGGAINSNQLVGLDLSNFQQNHPRITRLGTFFFFRGTASTTQNAAYAPSGPAVVGAALDLSMPVLFNFHLFIEAFNHIKPKDANSEAPAKILPIIFLSVLIVRSVVPPGRRGRFWSTIKFTVMSPFHRVRFRDCFVGDVITSLVRPGQDLLFALSYYVTVIWGSVSGKYGLTESGRILESSWLLHNVVLPSCALLPLWWKFLQTLRQAYDEGSRWPHLGNAFKHLLATLVILYVAHAVLSWACRFLLFHSMLS
jgi:EXS family